MAVLAEYLFNTSNGTETGAGYEPSTTAAGLTNSDVGNGGGNIDLDVGVAGTYTGNPVLIALTTGTNSATIAAAVTNNCYVSFTLTPSALKKVSFTNLTFNIARGGTATPRNYALRSSVDSYAADIATAEIPTQRSVWTAVDISLAAAAYQDVTTAITFRIYLSTPSLGQTIEADSIVFNGTVADITTTVTLSKTLDSTTIASTATSTVTASLSKTLDSTTIASTAATTATASLSKTLDGTTVTSAVATTDTATLTKTLGNVSLAATYTVASTGEYALSKTLGSTTLSSTATLSVVAAASKTLDATTLSAAASVSSVASLTKTLASVALATTVVAEATASLAKTLGGVSVSSTVVTGTSVALTKTLDATTLSAEATIPIVAQLMITLGNTALNAFVSGPITYPTPTNNRFVLLGLRTYK